MVTTENRLLLPILGAFGAGVLLQFLGCLLWGNWWPLLTAFAYVLIPMPYLFFGSSASGTNMASGWVDAGKFLIGVAGVSTGAIPFLLHHAGKITTGALWTEILAVMLMGGALLAYDFLTDEDDGIGFYRGY